MSKILAAVAISVMLSSCASVDPPQLRGHYYWGHEVETFRPCASEQTFWVVGDNALLQPLRNKAAELAEAKGQPYQSVYLEASGMPEGKATDGFAADYDGVYRLTAVHGINKPSPASCTAHG